MVIAVPGPKSMQRLPSGWTPFTPTRFVITPLSPTLGVEVRGLDLSRALDDATRHELWRTLLEWKLLVFHDQPLTPPEHVAFALRFGVLFDDSTDAPPKPDPLDNYVRFVREPGQAGLDNVWHADGSFRPAPPVALTLHALEVPPLGGDTLFADMAVAYDNLADEVKQRIATLDAANDWSVGFYAQSGVYGDRFAAIKQTLPAVHHRVARPHPVTGRMTLYANMAFTAALDDGDAAFLTFLQSQAEVPEYQVRLSWHANTFVLFDNQALQHYATNNYMPHRRVMGRATIASWHDELQAIKPYSQP